MPCAVCGGASPLQCARCSFTQYCSRQCQKKHWSVHRKVCARPPQPQPIPQPQPKPKPAPTPKPLSNVTDIPPVPGTDSRRVLVVLHGTGGASASVARRLRDVVGLPYRMVAVESGRRPPGYQAGYIWAARFTPQLTRVPSAKEPVFLEGCVGRVHRVLDRLVAKEGVHPADVVLFGVGVGGTMAVHAANTWADPRPLGAAVVFEGGVTNADARAWVRCVTLYVRLGQLSRRVSPSDVAKQLGRCRKRWPDHEAVTFLQPLSADSHDMLPRDLPPLLAFLHEKCPGSSARL